MDDPMEEPGREIGLADLIHDPNTNAIVVRVRHGGRSNIWEALFSGLYEGD